MLKDTQVQMTTVYSRNKGTSVTKPKRIFNLVISGLMFSSTLLGCLTVSGGYADASTLTASSQPNYSQEYVTSQNSNYVDDEALIADMKMAFDILERNGMSVQTLKALCNSLTNITNRLDDNQFFAKDALKGAISAGERVFAKAKLTGNETYKNEYLASVAKMNQIKNKLSPNSVGITSVSQNIEVKAATAAVQQVQSTDVYLDGAKMSYKESPFLEKGVVLIPLKDTFERLGAKVTINSKTNTIVVTKDKTTLKYPIGESVMYINNKKVNLTVKTRTVNKTVMFPSNSLVAAWGSSVRWNANPKVLVITSKAQTVRGIAVHYGVHNYASKNQKEYDAVMQEVYKTLNTYNTLVFGESRGQYYLEYLDGASWDGDVSNRSPRNIGLKLAENSVGALLEAGVSKEGIIRAWKTAFMAGDLTGRGATDPGDGSPRSAYDNLFRKKIDCDAYAETQSAVFDAMGYRTMLIAGSGHADMLVEIEGKWFSTGSSSFMRENPVLDTRAGEFLLSTVTYGRLPSK